MDSTVGDPVQQEPPLLSCRSVSKYFGALAAVQDLSFDARPGEVLGIGGPNGAGKTTLFDVISGLNPASAGTIQVCRARYRKRGDRIGFSDKASPERFSSTRASIR